MTFMSWDNMHLQSRQELCAGAGLNKFLAPVSWDSLDGWVQQILNDSLKGRTHGKVCFM